MSEVEKLIRWTNSEQLTDFATDSGLAGGCAYDAHGKPFPDEDMDKAVKSRGSSSARWGSEVGQRSRMTCAPRRASFASERTWPLR